MAGRSPRELSGRERAEWVLVRALGTLRLAQYLAAGVAAASLDRSVYHRPAVVFGLYAVAVVWSLGLFAVALRGRRITGAAIMVDVLLIAIALVAVGRLITPDEAVDWANWTVAPAHAAGLLAVVFGRRASVSAASVGLLAVCYLAGVWPGLAGDPSALAAVAGNIGSLVLFTAVAAFAAAWLRSSARALDEAHESRIEAQRQAAEAANKLAAFEASARERIRQYRALHDTVLSTLTVGAMGLIDLNSEQFRAQCDRDSRYLRALMSGPAGAVSTDLRTVLARVVRDVEALGLRIEQQVSDLPTRIPSNVVEAVAGATREALNNARKHAGTGLAWLTARGDGTGGLQIAVVDRGTGFEPTAVQGGYGLLGSIRHRVIEARGRCDITSVPLEGTTVEISWTP